jgi:hypothetical protein
VIAKTSAPGERGSDCENVGSPGERGSDCENTGGVTHYNERKKMSELNEIVSVSLSREEWLKVKTAIVIRSIEFAQQGENSLCEAYNDIYRKVADQTLATDPESNRLFEVGL